MNYTIAKDIRIANTLPASFYKDATVFDALIEKSLVPFWHFIGDEDMITGLSYAHPFVLLENSLDEPLVLVRDKSNNLACLSNICTHRGMFLIDKPGKYRLLSCKYHGRCFNLDGSFRSMPEFKETENFPSEMDNLPRLPLHNLGKFLFTSIGASVTFKQVFGPMLDRMHWFNFDQLSYNELGSEDYLIDTHWSLYCDNYLEGFHVPFVHPGLNQALDYKEYDTELFEYCNLQLGIASDGAPKFDLPSNAVDYGKDVFAYYWWVFPNMMFNFYTWGVSVNIVEPINRNKTRVRFLTYLFNDKRAAAFSKQEIHDTELEDEEVVKRVHKGVQSRLYKHGRFSPSKEQGVHHFHRLLAKSLKQ